MHARGGALSEQRGVPAQPWHAPPHPRPRQPVPRAHARAGPSGQVPSIPSATYSLPGLDGIGGIGFGVGRDSAMGGTPGGGPLQLGVGGIGYGSPSLDQVRTAGGPVGRPRATHAAGAHALRRRPAGGASSAPRVDVARTCLRAAAGLLSASLRA